MLSLLRRAVLIGLPLILATTFGCSGQDPNETNPDLKAPKITPGRSQTDKAVPPKRRGK